MKTKNLLPILLLAVSMVSCTTYYQVKTQVFPDGSARREVYAFGDSAFMAGNRAQNPFMFSLDSGWTVMRFDSVRMHNYFGEKEKIIKNQTIGKVYSKDQHGNMMKIQRNTIYICLVKSNQI